MIKTNSGSSISSMSINLSTDWRKMLTPRAKRKTPLKKAPSSRALCHPNERSCGYAVRSDIYVTVLVRIHCH